MPAGTLKISSFEELETLGRRLTAKAEALETELATIRAQADPSGIWESGAASQYQLSFERWSVSQTGLITSLRDMGQFLISAAAAYRSQDAEIMRGFDLA